LIDPFIHPLNDHSLKRQFITSRQNVSSQIHAVLKFRRRVQFPCPPLFIFVFRWKLGLGAGTTARFAKAPAGPPLSSAKTKGFLKERNRCFFRPLIVYSLSTIREKSGIGEKAQGQFFPAENRAGKNP
jgi:hypothetical protein